MDQRFDEGHFDAQMFIGELLDAEGTVGKRENQMQIMDASKSHQQSSGLALDASF